MVQDDSRHQSDEGKTWTADLEEYFRRQQKKCLVLYEVHSDKATNKTNVTGWVGTIATIVSACTTVTMGPFVAFRDECDGDRIEKIVVFVLSLISTCVVAFNKASKWPDEIRGHEQAARKFLGISDDIDLQLEYPREQRQNVHHFRRTIVKLIREAEEAAPSIDFRNLYVKESSWSKIFCCCRWFKSETQINEEDYAQIFHARHHGRPLAGREEELQMTLQ